ncbi:MAG: hypothetical protein VX210_03000 [Myxococcota bacterium]|nr:hypothetical protein [Myxococcota bacterium]
MSALAWVIVGVLGEAVFTSLASMWHVEYVFPQWFLVVMMFVAVNRELFSALGVAVLLGVVVGRFALAPWGLYELSLIVTSVIVFRFSATLSGRGAIFFGVLCIVASIGFQIGTLSLLSLVRDHVGFASPATAALFPTGFATGLVAALSHGLFVRIEKRLEPTKREGLKWV